MELETPFEWKLVHLGQKRAAHVADGSKPALTAPNRHFRATPNNGHHQTGPVGCEKWTRRANQRRCLTMVCPAPFEKIFWFSENANHPITPAVLSFREGRWPSSRTLGRDAVDAGSAQDESADLADGEVVWSW